MIKYNSEDKMIMGAAFDTITSIQDRIDDIIIYSKSMGHKKIGIANCISVNGYAKAVEAYLSEYFEIISIHCKNGRINSEDIVEGSYGISCNPIGQADYLNSQETNLNITMGLCIGHDIVFSKYSRAPVTNLLVKDRKNRHDIIYSIESKF
ncbi:DUF1847 domain-containing protein [Acidaminobacter sp. JC074]|uniref:DUF1847 domain-containing protein n=1 Tax=Acidaminobacter sp. JC074 TaxID=2530199 RepID=UPI001F0D9B36|nr:DUF1847 domain-containing protein [Acidaminobacter sp. JC074]MCH4887544.1 DUF1847 domain-containing protein [Acidaminobacter sp. JC074]